MTAKGIFHAIWQFVSFLFVPQQGKHITEQAQSYYDDDQQKRVSILIEKERENGRIDPITPKFVATVLHLSLPDVTAALAAAKNLKSAQ